MSFRALSLDFGQTIARLDARLLAERAMERGVVLCEQAIRGSLGPAWRTYDRLVREGVSGHPWHQLMRTLLAEAGLADDAVARELTEFLWEQQPKKNLWREPIEGMIELCERASAEGVPLVVISNSEGKLRDLIAEMGLSELLPLVIDSGVVGITKPSPAIFALGAELVGVPCAEVLHVGDSLAADVRGALDAGMGAVWFGQPRLPDDLRDLGARGRAFAAEDAGALAAVLDVALDPSLRARA